MIAGIMHLPNLPPGQYESRYRENKDSRKQCDPEVDVVVNTDTRVNLTLEPGSHNRKRGGEC